MPDPLFQELFEETADTRWQPVSDLRERVARRRRRAQVGLMAAAAAAVLVASAGIAVARLDRTAPAPAITPTTTVPPTTPAPTTPAPTATTPPASLPLGDTLFLQPDDVGYGYRLVSGEGSGDWTFEFSTSALDCRYADRPVTPQETVERALVRGLPSEDERVAQAVSRFRAGDAARYLAQVRDRVAACEPGGGRTISIAARDFAGQGALLVAVDYGGGFTTHHVLVRQGDLLAEFFVKPGLDPPLLEDLGRTAASRLCAGTDAC